MPLRLQFSSSALACLVLGAVGFWIGGAFQDQEWGRTLRGIGWWFSQFALLLFLVSIAHNIGDLFSWLIRGSSREARKSNDGKDRTRIEAPSDKE